MSKALLISIPVSATFAGMASMISSPPNLIVVEALKSKGYHVSFFDWMVLGVPVAFILLFFFWLILRKKYTSKVDKINLDFLKKQPPIPKEIKIQRLIVVITLAVTVILWMMGNELQIPTAFAAAVPITFLPMLGVITAEDIRKLPWDTLMLVAGGLALGLAIKDLLAPYYSQQLAGIPLYTIPTMIAFALITVLCSNFMSSTATATIIVNVAAVMLPIDLLLPTALVIGLCSSCGLFLPVSTPPNAIVFSTGMIKQKDFILGGTFGAIVGTFVIMIWIFILQYGTDFFGKIAAN